MTEAFAENAVCFLSSLFYISAVKDSLANRTAEKRFARSVHSLNDIFTFISESLSSASPDALYKIRFAVEEIFTNMVKYNAAGKSDILLRCSDSGDNADIQIVDEDSPYFDPTTREKPDLKASIEQKRPGGLGIYLVKEMLDGFEYAHRNRTSTITIRQHLRS